MSSSCLSPLCLFLRQTEEEHGAEKQGRNMGQRNRGETWGRETGEKHEAERQGRNMRQRDRGETWGRETSEDSSPSPSCSSSQPQLVDNYFATNSFFSKRK